MKFQIHYKERFYLITMFLISIVVYVGLIFNLMDNLVFHKLLLNGKFLSYMYVCLFIFFINIFITVLSIGILKGNAIKINKNQFPEIFEILESQSKKLGLKRTPYVYLQQSNGVLNAFATKFANRGYVILYSSILEAAYEEGIDAVSFIIGHELGHLKRNHISWVRTIVLFPARCLPFLSEAYSRACEYTCDNIGYNLAPKGALNGILILAAGKKLYKNVNVNEFLLNMNSSKFFVAFAEIFSTHPALIKRFATIYKLNQDNLLSDYQSFVAPNVDIKEIQVN